MRRICRIIAVVIIASVMLALSACTGTAQKNHSQISGNAYIRQDGMTGILGVLEIGKYDEVGAFSEGYAPVCIGERWGFIDKLGNLVVKTNWEEVGPFCDGLAKVRGESGYGYIDAQGNVVIKPDWYDASDFSEGYAWVQSYDEKKGKSTFYIITPKGKTKKTDKKCEQIYGVFSEGRVVARSEDGYGFIDAKGKFAVKPEYDEVKPFSEGLAPVGVSGRWGYVNTKGHMDIPLKWGAALPFSDSGKAWVLDPKDSVYKCIDKAGTVKYALTRDADSLQQGIIPVDETDGLTLVKAQNGDMGVVDQQGNLILTCYNEEVMNGKWASLHLAGNGFVHALTKDRYAYLDLNGDRVSDTMWEQVTAFDEGVAYAKAFTGRHYILYADIAVEDTADKLIREGRYKDISQMIINAKNWCIGWNEYYGRNIDNIAKYYADLADQLMQEGAYEYAAAIYEAIGMDDSYLMAYAKRALALIESGEYDQACTMIDWALQAADEASEDACKIAQETLRTIDYYKAQDAMEAGDYRIAAEMFAAAGAYSDAQTRKLEAHYRYGEALKAQGLTEEAMQQMIKALGYADAREQVEAYYLPKAEEQTARGEYRKAAYLLACMGMPEYLREAYALRSAYLMDERMAWDAYDQKIVAVLSADGTVCTNESSQPLLTEEPDLQAIEVCSGVMFGLRKDGTVVSGRYNYDTSAWSDIVAICTGEHHIVGLRSDGTVVAVGSDDSGQLEVEDWRDVIEVAGSYHATYGLRRDGTVLTTKRGAKSVSGWKDIVDISACSYVAGLRADGVILLAINDWCTEIEAPQNTVAISVVDNSVICLLADGTVEALEAKADKKALLGTYRDVAAVADGELLIDRSGKILPKKLAISAEGGKMLVPPAMLMTPREEWLPQAQALIENGAYAHAMDLVMYRQEQPEAAQLYQQLSEIFKEEENEEESAELVQQRDEELRVQAQSLMAEGRELGALYLLRRLSDSEAVKQAYHQLYASPRSRPTLEAKQRTGWTVSEDGVIQVDEDVLEKYPAIAQRGGFIASTGNFNWVAGLTPEGEVWVMGNITGGEWEKKWTDVVAMDSSGYNLIALRADGTVLVSWWDELDAYYSFSEEEIDVSDWRDIAAVEIAGTYAVGLKRDGTVVVKGIGFRAEMDVSSWTDIVDISCGRDITVGMRSDGTVVAAGKNARIIRQIEEWTKIEEIIALHGPASVVGMRWNGKTVEAED